VVDEDACAPSTLRSSAPQPFTQQRRTHGSLNLRVHAVLYIYCMRAHSRADTREHAVLHLLHARTLACTHKGACSATFIACARTRVHTQGSMQCYIYCMRAHSRAHTREHAVLHLLCKFKGACTDAHAQVCKERHGRATLQAVPRTPKCTRKALNMIYTKSVGTPAFFPTELGIAMFACQRARWNPLLPPAGPQVCHHLPLAV